MRFNYSIQPGVREFSSLRSRVLLSSRHNKDSHFTLDTGVKILPEQTAIISLVFNPVKLASRKQWHMIATDNPSRIATALLDCITPQVRPDDARLALSQFALYAASGSPNGLILEGHIDELVAALPRYEQAVPTRQLVHKQGFGAAMARLTTNDASSVA